MVQLPFGESGSGGRYVDAAVIPEHAAHAGVDRGLVDDVEPADVELDGLAGGALARRGCLTEVSHRGDDAKARLGETI